MASYLANSLTTCGLGMPTLRSLLVATTEPNSNQLRGKIRGEIIGACN